MTDTLCCVAAIYVAATPGDVWNALTDPDVSMQWWAHRNDSDWNPGSRWEHQRADDTTIVDIAGTVIDSEPPRRLVLTWANPVDGTPVAGVAPRRRGDQRPSRVAFDIEPHDTIVRLTVTHDNLTDETEQDALAAGWAAVLSNLKSYLETGTPLPTAPWEMLQDFVRR